MQKLSKPIQPQHKFFSTILAFAIMPISGLATDIYLPSMPDMALSLGISASRVQLTLSLFLISYGLSQFFIGALADVFGRYWMSLFSLFLFMLSFYWTAQTENIYVIYFNRILQGILAGCAVVSKRAFFVDVYEGEERKHYLSIVTIVWSLAPILAPFVGGYLQTNFGWQSNFLVLAIYSGFLFVLELIFTGETIQEKKVFKSQLFINEFITMFKTKDFLYGMFMCGISYSLVMFYNLSGPFIIENRLGFSAMVTGYASLIMGFAWMLGGILGRAMIKTSFLPKIRNANYFQIVLITLMILTSLSISNIYSLVVFAFLIHLCAGFIFNNYFAYCMGRFPNSAGFAGGLIGGVAFIITSALSYTVVAVLKPISQIQIGFGYGVIAILGFFVLWAVKKQKLHI